MSFPKFIGIVRPAVVVLMAIGVVLYFGAFVCLTVNQRSFIFPGQKDRGAAIIPMPGCRVMTLLTPSLRFRVEALYAPALAPHGPVDPESRRRPTILFFTGNGGDINGLGPVIARLQRLDANVLVAEYPGYGRSSGTPSEEGCYDTADAAYNFVLSEKNKTPIIAAGWSLGSGVAIHLASTREVTGLATFCAYTSMADMASHDFPIFPAALLNVALHDKFPSRQAIHHVHCPVFMAHGTADEVVPYFMLRQLESAAAGPATLCTIYGGKHDILFDTGPGGVYPALGEWLNKIARADGALHGGG
jgi:fermentation-respiration switch protein FrsA (DUF1100 family)